MQAEIDAVDSWYGWFLPILKILGISMALHGLYDTFLKRDLGFPALATAGASFVWFVWLNERAQRAEAATASAAAA
jgi:hypothetical protein